MKKYSEVPFYDFKREYINVRNYEINSCKLHWHSYYELEIVVSGEGYQTVNGTKYSYKTGDAFLLGPADFHEICLEKSAKVWLLQIPVWGMNKILHKELMEKAVPVFTHLTKEQFETLENLLKILKDNFENKQQRQLTDNALSTLLLYFFGLDTKKVNTVLTDRLSEIYLYLQEHFSENITIDDIASHFALNKNYLCTYFKKNTDKTIIECLRELRLMYASHLVVCTEKTTQEICFDAGYSSISNFLRDFKKRFNVSPLEMRKNN